MNGEFNEQGEFRLNREPSNAYTEAVKADSTSKRKAPSADDLKHLNETLNRQTASVTGGIDDKFLRVRAEQTASTPVHKTVEKAVQHHNLIVMAVHNVAKLLKTIVGVATKERNQIAVGAKDRANMSSSIVQSTSEPNPPTPQG